MLLSAQIGIAGSVIGVAVGSVVSTVASQVYKRFLEQSATKLRGMRDSDEESSTGGVGDAEGLEGFEAVPYGTEEDDTASTEEDVRADGPKAGQAEQTEFAGGSMRAVDQLASGRVIAGECPAAPRRRLTWVISRSLGTSLRSMFARSASMISACSEA